MHAGKAFLLLFVSLFVAIFATGTAAALMPVPHVVLEVTSAELVSSSNLSNPVYRTDFVLNWKLSPDDPDQVNGDYEYRWIWNGTDFGPISGTPIAGRAGWLHLFPQTSGNDPGVHGITIVANDTATQTASVPSCLVTAEFRINLWHSECGNDTLETVPGVSAVVTNESVEGESGAIAAIRWKPSPDDPDQTNGSFSYWLYGGICPTLDQCEWENEIGLTLNLTYGTYSVESAGVFLTSIEQGIAPGGTIPLNVWLLARDNLTLQRSEFSCKVFVQNGALYERMACGEMPVPGGGFAAISGASFPFVNMTFLQEESGLSETVLSAIFGGATVLGIATMGYLGAKTVGATVGALLSIALIASLGLMPGWLLVVLFMGALTLLVISLRKGGEPQ